MQIEPMTQAAKLGGQVLMKYFGQTLETKQKSIVADFCTKADLESEHAILTVLNSAFPDYNIYSEEQGQTDRKSEYTFVIDPLDGTNNFCIGIPNFSVSIALLKGNEIVAGVIYVPVLNQTYYAEKGHGAFLDGKKLSVNSESDIVKSTISVVVGYDMYKIREAISRKLFEKHLKRSLNNWSSAFDLCLVAAGKIEGIINQKSEIYDFAAGKLIAREAGALVTDFDGNPDQDRSDTFILSNGSDLHQQLIEIIK